MLLTWVDLWCNWCGFGMSCSRFHIQIECIELWRWRQPPEGMAGNGASRIQRGRVRVWRRTVAPTSLNLTKQNKNQETIITQLCALCSFEETPKPFSPILQLWGNASWTRMESGGTDWTAMYWSSISPAENQQKFLKSVTLLSITTKKTMFVDWFVEYHIKHFFSGVSFVGDQDKVFDNRNRHFFIFAGQKHSGHSYKLQPLSLDGLDC